MAAVLAVATSTLACTELGEDGDDHGETEIISRVELTFTPVAGGEPIVAAFSDPDGDGGASGSSEPIVLSAGESYELSIALYNDLVDPVEDIGEEVREEAEEHMFFLAEDGGLTMHAYADLESDYGENAVGEDLPLGALHTVDALVAGSGELRVVLRHLPEFNGVAQKSGDLPERFAAGEALPGEVDVDVSFELSVE